MDIKKMMRLNNFLTEGKHEEPDGDEIAGVEPEDDMDEGFGDTLQKGYYKAQQKRHKRGADKQYNKGVDRRSDGLPTQGAFQKSKASQGKSDSYGQKANAVDARRKQQQVDKLSKQREKLTKDRQRLESNMPVNAQDPRWGITDAPKTKIFGEAKNKYPEIMPALETVEDIYTMLDIAFDDAQSALASIDQKDARSFQQAMDMMEKSADFMMKILKKHK